MSVLLIEIGNEKKELLEIVVVEIIDLRDEVEVEELVISGWRFRNKVREKG